MTLKRTQEQRIDYLIRYLLSERKEYQNTGVPANLSDKGLLLRSLMNVRPPAPVRSKKDAVFTRACRCVPTASFHIQYIFISCLLPCRGASESVP